MIHQLAILIGGFWSIFLILYLINCYKIGYMVTSGAQIERGVKLTSSDIPMAEGGGLFPSGGAESEPRPNATCVLVAIKNLAEIGQAWGVDAAEAVRDHVDRELAAIEKVHQSFLQVDQMESGNWAIWPRLGQFPDAFVPLVRPALMDLLLQPVVVKGECLVPVLDVTKVTRRWATSQPQTTHTFPTSASDLMPAMGYVWQFPKHINAYRDQTRAAVALIADLQIGYLGWGARTVTTSNGSGWPLYQSVRRYRIGANGEYEGIDREVRSLARLGLIRSYDVETITWALTKLRADPDLQLGVSISAQSLIQDVWWDDLFQKVKSEPHLGQRLVIELECDDPLPDLAMATSVREKMRLGRIRLSLNNFGLNSTDLPALFHLRPDMVNISQILINKSGADDRWRGATGSLIELIANITKGIIVDDISSPLNLEEIFGGNAFFQRRGEVSSVRRSSVLGANYSQARNASPSKGGVK